jgi:hypothetical protein
MRSSPRWCWASSLRVRRDCCAALKSESERESALVTFLVTASGVSLFGIGSALWGLVAGAFSLAVLQANWTKVLALASGFSFKRGRGDKPGAQ